MADIRIRSAGGGVTTVPQGQFVEICDENGDIGCLVYQNSKGVVRVVMPDDLEDAKRYSSIFGAKFCTKVRDMSPSIVNARRPK